MDISKDSKCPLIFFSPFETFLSPATTIIDTRNHMPSDVLYTHPNALICQNKNGGGGPITYQFIILYR